MDPGSLGSSASSLVSFREIITEKFRPTLQLRFRGAEEKILSFYHVPLCGDFFADQFSSLPRVGAFAYLPVSSSLPLLIAMPENECQPLTFPSQMVVTHFLGRRITNGGSRHFGGWERKPGLPFPMG